MFYKGTNTECKDYNLEVYNGTASMKQDPFTTSYASIQQIENNFYILKNKDFNSNMEEVSQPPKNTEL